MTISKKTIKTISESINDLNRNLDISKLDDNTLWIYDEDKNAGILEVENKRNKVLIRGKDTNTYLCFMRGKKVTKKNVKLSIETMDKWNSKDRSSTYEYFKNWRTE